MDAARASQDSLEDENNQQQNNQQQQFHHQQQFQQTGVHSPQKTFASSTNSKPLRRTRHLIVETKRFEFV